METTTEPDHAGSARVTVAKIARVLLWVVYVWLIVNLVLLVLAFILLLLGANPTASFVEWVYRSAGRTMAPFRGMFEPIQLNGESVLDTSLLFAMIVYSLATLFLRFAIDWVSARITPPLPAYRQPALPSHLDAGLSADLHAFLPARLHAGATPAPRLTPGMVSRESVQAFQQDGFVVLPGYLSAEDIGAAAGELPVVFPRGTSSMTTSIPLATSGSVTSSGASSTSRSGWRSSACWRCTPG